jgi:iron(III) transport system substrate-binding protein
MGDGYGHEEAEMRGCLARGILIAVVAVLAAGCGSPTENEEREKSDRGTGASKLEKVYTQVEGLAPDARRKKLLELAEKEGGELNVYGSANLDEAEPIMSAFEDLSGIDPNLYRASSSDLLQRILQEANANFKNGADVIYTNGPELQVLDDQNLLLPLESPFTKDLVQEALVSKNWAPVYLNAFVTAWNTKRVAQPPQTWESVLADYKGKLAMEVGDWDWFATLVTQYFEEQKGMSEDEAVALFKRAAGGARMVDGHTLMTELLAAGEFSVASSVYKHRAEQLKKDGAPVEWVPPVEPIVIRPNGVGIFADTQVPATALLFADFMLTDVQNMLIEFDRTPASSKVPGGGIPSEYKVLVADLRQLNDRREKWEKLYEDIARSSGNVIED